MQCFRSFDTAERMIQGVEAAHMLRKGQIERLGGRDGQGRRSSSKACSESPLSRRGREPLARLYSMSATLLLENRRLSLSSGSQRPGGSAVWKDRLLIWNPLAASAVGADKQRPLSHPLAAPKYRTTSRFSKIPFFVR